MESTSGTATRVWGRDGGRGSADTRAGMRAPGARNRVGPPPAMRNTCAPPGGAQNWEAGQPGVAGTRCRAPEGTDEPVVLGRAAGRTAPANVSRTRVVLRLEPKRVKLAEQGAPGRARAPQHVARQSGRVWERHRRAAALFPVTVNAGGCGTDARRSLPSKKHDDRSHWARATGGHALRRTPWTEREPKTLWKTALQLTEGDDRFCLDTDDVGRRPIFHQNQDRPHAPILVCVLALTRWRSLPQGMHASGLGTAPRKRVEERRARQSLDGPLPTRENTLRLRRGTTAPTELPGRLQRLKMLLPNRPTVLETVVTNMAGSSGSRTGRTRCTLFNCGRRGSFFRTVLFDSSCDSQPF